MSTALTTTNNRSIVAETWDAEQVRLIKEQFCPDITDPELRLFAHVCRHVGLDPFLNQIHAIKRWDSMTNGKKLTIQTSIHGLRLIADRTRCYAPGRRADFETDIDGQLISATAYVLKYAQGTWHEVSETAYWDEYVQRNKSGQPAALWGSKPRVMLAKVAEALALRRAFPAETAGVYTDEEMPTPPPVAPPPPARIETVDTTTGEVIEPAHNAPQSRPDAPGRAQAVTTAPSAPAPQDVAFNYNDFWTTIRGKGISGDEAGALALARYERPVPKLQPHELRALADALLAGERAPAADEADLALPLGVQ